MRMLMTGFLTIFLLMADLAFTADQVSRSTHGDRENNQAMYIHIDRGRLTVKLREASIISVLEEIWRLTGIEIVILGSLTENISMEFEDLPLDEGMQRLLKNYGCSLVTTGVESNPLEKVFVVSSGDKMHLYQRQESPAFRNDQKAGPHPVDSPADPVAVLIGKKEIQHYFDILLRDPGSMAEMIAFAEAANSLSKEEIEPIIEMLENESFQPSGLEPALSGVSEEDRGRIIRNMRNLDIKAEVVGRLKQIHQAKTAQ